MMDLTTALDMAREALLTALLTAAPMLGVGIVVGLLISLFQTVTQLNLRGIQSMMTRSIARFKLTYSFSFNHGSIIRVATTNRR